MDSIHVETMSHTCMYTTAQKKNKIHQKKLIYSKPLEFLILV